jgi:hypothetical protein
MIVDRIDAKADDLAVALLELRLELSHVAELGRADRREVLGMGEQHAPRVAHPFVEADQAFGRVYPHQCTLGAKRAQLSCGDVVHAAIQQFRPAPYTGHTRD